MRWNILALLAGVAIMLSVGAANAESSDSRGLFIGLGLETYNLKVSGSDNGNHYNVKGKPLGITGRIGYFLLPWLSVNLHASTGIHEADSEGRINGGRKVDNGGTELKYLVGVGVRPQYQLHFGGTSRLTFFAAGGYGKYKFEGDLKDDIPRTPAKIDFSADDNSGYYGGGVSIDGDAGSFILQYTNYVDKSHTDFESFQLSVNKYF